MLRRIKITLCLGSSCFARGNNELISYIKKYMIRKKIEDKVEFLGGHCFESCSKGPNLLIGSTLFQEVNTHNIEEILNKGLAEIFQIQE